MTNGKKKNTWSWNRGRNSFINTATPLNNILDPETNMETHSNERVEGLLDYPITDEEIEAVT